MLEVVKAVKQLGSFSNGRFIIRIFRSNILANSDGYFDYAERYEFRILNLRNRSASRRLSALAQAGDVGVEVDAEQMQKANPGPELWISVAVWGKWWVFIWQYLDNAYEPLLKKQLKKCENIPTIAPKLYSYETRISVYPAGIPALEFECSTSHKGIGPFRLFKTSSLSDFTDFTRS